MSISLRGDKSSILSTSKWCKSLQDKTNSRWNLQTTLKRHSLHFKTSKRICKLVTAMAIWPSCHREQKARSAMDQCDQAKARLRLTPWTPQLTKSQSRISFTRQANPPRKWHQWNQANNPVLTKTLKGPVTWSLRFQPATQSQTS